MRDLIKRTITILSLITLSPLCLANEYVILGGNASKELTKTVAEKLRTPVGAAIIDRYNDGEINIKIEKSVRGKNVYIVQSIAKSSAGSVNDNLVELYLLIRTLKRASAGNITAIIPYYGYARQDRKTESRVPISASDVAMLLENSGVDRVVAIDLHAGQIQGFFHNVPVDNIYGSIFMAPKFAELKLKDPVVVSPDAGGLARAKKFRDTLGMYGIHADLAIIVKQRARAGVIESANLIGDVKGRDAIIVDDICDTGGTLVKAAEELKKFGANKVYASITHPVFSNDAIKKIENSQFEQVFVSDSIAIAPGNYKKITQVSIANLVAMVIDHLDQGESLSDLFLAQKTYTEEFGTSKIVPISSVYPNFKTTIDKLNIASNQAVNILVTSNNEIKMRAAGAIFKEKYHVAANKINVKGFKTNSGVSEQPVGLDAAIKGARNRINDLKAEHAVKDDTNRYIVSIESFCSEMPKDGNPTDHALLIIEDPQGKQHIFVSAGVEVASDIYKIAVKQENVTVGQVLAQRYNVSANDWHSYVTGNQIDRYTQILTAVN